MGNREQQRASAGQRLRPARLCESQNSPRQSNLETVKNNNITPADTVRLAFTDGEYVSPEAIGEADIEAALRRRIEPVAGRALCEAMREGAYPDFVSEYAAPALALCVRLVVQPRLNAATGQTGLAVPAGANR